MLSFWVDCWCRKRPLKERFSNIFALAKDKDVQSRKMEREGERERKINENEKIFFKE